MKNIFKKRGGNNDLRDKILNLKISSLPFTLAELHTTVTINDKEIIIELGLPIAAIKEELQTAVQSCIGDEKPRIIIQQNIIAHAIQPGLRGLENVKNIIAVASGKGGVGKSTTTANLALALAHMGAKVGVLDADIYGPNQAHMLGVQGQPEVIDEKKFMPMLAYGIQVMSMAFLMQQQDTPMIWRGPMVSSALQQLLQETLWQDLDYLFVDLPPGTGDIQLTLSQKIPVSGAIIVSTPQDIALLDAKKAIRMFEKVQIPTLGIVENMSLHICSQCGHQEAIFGEGGAVEMAKQYQVEFLGALPLEMCIRVDSDAGKPTVEANPSAPASKIYQDISLLAAARLACQDTDFSRKFPKIVIE